MNKNLFPPLVFALIMGLTLLTLPAIAVAPLIYLIPLILGWNLTIIIRKLKNLPAPYPSVPTLTSYFLIGALTQFLLLGFFSFLGNYAANKTVIIQFSLTLTYLLISIIAFILAFFRKDQNQSTFHLSLGELFLVPLLIFFSAIYFFIWKGNTTEPGIVNWDILHQTVLINHLVAGNFNFLSSSVSDTFTFNGYLPLIHSLFAVPIILFKTTALPLYWWAEFIYYLISVATSYWLAKKLISLPMSGIIGAILGAFIFESNVAYTNLFLLPQTLTATVGVILLTKFAISQRPKLSLSFLLSSLTLVLTHSVIGLAYFFGLSIILATKQIDRFTKNQRIKILVLFISLILPFACALLGLNHLFILPGRLEAKDFVYSTVQKLSFFYQWYGLFPPMFLPIGFFYFLRKQFNKSFSLLIVTLFFASLSIFPFSYSLKFFTLEHYFLNTLLAGGTAFVLSKITLRPFRYLFLIIVAIALFTIFLQNILTHLQSSFNGRTNSYISPQDFETATFLTKNYDPNKTFLISDPTTQATLEATTGINTQGGAFPRPDTVDILDPLQNESSPEIFYYNLLKIHDTLPHENLRTKTLFVLSGRYFAWQEFPEEQKKNYFYQVWTSQKIWKRDEPLIKRLSQSPYFRLVFRNNEDAILELQ